MTSSTRADVLVIGAGPVGLTLACELQRRGVAVRLVDRLEKPQPHPNAAVVHVRTLEILSAMGAVEGFRREGYTLPGMHLRVLGKHIGFVDVCGVDSPFPGPRMLGQQITERLLTEHLTSLGGRVERSIEGIGLEQDANEVRVTLRHPAANNREEVATAAWVVGCEGSASMTRQALNIPFPGKRYAGKEFLQMDARLRWNHPHGFGYMFVAGDHILGCLPYDAKGLYRIICGRNDPDPENKAAPTLAEMQELVRLTADPAAELYEAAWFNRFRTGYHLAERLREGRVFLAGDAGHVHIPIGGQGMNYGMHDAFNLGWKLAQVIKGEARPELLDSYDAERHPVDESLIRATDRAFHVMVQQHPVVRAGMGLFGSAVLSLPAVRHGIRDGLAEMNVAYPAGALSEDHGGSGGPAAGDRAPDALVVRLPERETTSLFDVLRGTQWTLLLFAGRQPTEADVEKRGQLVAALRETAGAKLSVWTILGEEPTPSKCKIGTTQVLMDRELYAHAKYGIDAAPCLYLIRPDWHVAFRGGLEHQAQLLNYLERIFVKRAS